MSVEEFPRTAITPVATPIRVADRAATRTALFDRETVALGLVLSVALVSHAFNMFNYPLYRQDEGIVSQNAWSFIRNFQLSPYTYAYEHPPLATFLLSLWTVLTGGFHTFGSALNSGRVLMLVIHLGSTFFLYRSAQKLSNSTAAAMIAGLIFSLSPLAINFQRLLLVDNIMVFWLLATLYLIVNSNDRLFAFFMASLTLGLATVTRETAIFFVPAFLLLIWRSSDPFHRLYAVWGGMLIGGVVTLQYLLYAIFKSELLPDNFNFQAELDGKADHVSLTGTLYQTYHSAVPLWFGNQTFASIWNGWLGLDSALIFAGLGCTVFNLVFGFKHKENWIIPLIVLGYGLFIGLGGIDSDYMVVALVPFLAIAIGQTLGKFFNMLGTFMTLVITLTLLALVGYGYIANNQNVYTAQVNQTYEQALSWIKGNIPADRTMIISDALWVDLHDNYDGPAFNGAQSHWKAAHDPAVRVGIFKGDYKNVDYLIMSNEMRQEFSTRGEAFPQQALDNSSLIRQFVDSKQIMFEVRKVNNDKALIQPSTLQDAYNFYQSHFITSDGRVSDAKGHTTSAQQGQAMQMALWNNDQKTFDTVWNWTAFNLQLDNSLFRKDSGVTTARSQSSADAYTDTQADTDIALSLLLAGQRWNVDSYNKEAGYIIQSIWDKDVVQIHGKPYLKATAAPQAQTDQEVLLNLGAFSPEAYRLFAQADKKHDWMGLYNSGYDLLNKASWYGRGDYKGLGLAPGLVIMNTDTEELRAPNGTYGTRLSDFDEAGQQALWHVALDYDWYQSSQAKSYIQGSGWFLVKYWQKWQLLAGQYTNNGLPINNTENLSVYTVAGANASILNQIELADKLAKGEKAELAGANSETEIVARAFMGSFHHKDGQGYWMNQEDLNAQYWGWMGTAIHLNKLSIDFPQAAA